MPDTARVRIHVKARSPQIQLLRSVAGHLCAVEDFTVDDLEDVKLLVEEAAILLGDATEEDQELAADLSVSDSVFHARLQVPTARPLNRDSFAWTILESLAEDLSVLEDPSQIDISFSKGSLLELRGH